MLAYIARRLLQVLPVLLMTSIAVFLMIHMAAGDPAAVLAGENATPDVVAALRKEMGLDKPLAVQYVEWLGKVARGDLGVSYVSKYPVSALVKARMGATLELTLAGLAIGLVLGIPSGILAAVRSRRAPDYAVEGFSTVFLSVPTFWMGIAFIILFAVVLRWLPPSGRIPFTQSPSAAWKYLLLPSVTLGLHIGAVFSRFTRSALLEVLNEDYIRTARAKGLSDRIVTYRHALRNALVPVITVVGLQTGYMLGGSVVIESVFAWPGLGRLLVQSIANRDYMAVQAALLIFTFSFILINLLTDLIYVWVDPRIRLGGAGGRR